MLLRASLMQACAPTMFAPTVNFHALQLVPPASPPIAGEKSISSAHALSEPLSVDVLWQQEDGSAQQGAIYCATVERLVPSALQTRVACLTVSRSQSSRTRLRWATFTRKKCFCSRIPPHHPPSTAATAARVLSLPSLLVRYRSFVQPLELLRLLEQRLLCTGLSAADAFVVHVTRHAPALPSASSAAPTRRLQSRSMAMLKTWCQRFFVFGDFDDTAFADAFFSVLDKFESIQAMQRVAVALKSDLLSRLERGCAVISVAGTPPRSYTPTTSSRRTTSSTRPSACRCGPQRRWRASCRYTSSPYSGKFSRRRC